MVTLEQEHISQIDDQETTHSTDPNETVLSIDLADFESFVGRELAQQLIDAGVTVDSSGNVDLATSQENAGVFQDIYQKVIDAFNSRQLSKVEYYALISVLAVILTLFFGLGVDVGGVSAQENDLHPNPVAASHGNGGPEVAQVSTPSTENLDGRPAFQETKGEDVVGVYNVTATVDEIVVGTYESPLTFPIGNEFEGVAFAIISYDGKSGRQQLAVPLAYTSESGTYLNEGPKGFTFSASKFEPNSLTNVVLSVVITPNAENGKIGITFTDASGEGLGNQQNVKPIIDDVYPAGSLENFIQTENPVDLPDVGNVNGVPIFMPALTVFIS